MGKRKHGATLQNLSRISTNDKKTVTVCGGLSVALKIQFVLPTCVRDRRIFAFGQHLYFLWFERCTLRRNQTEYLYELFSFSICNIAAFISSMIWIRVWISLRIYCWFSAYATYDRTMTFFTKTPNFYCLLYFRMLNFIFFLYILC